MPSKLNNLDVVKVSQLWINKQTRSYRLVPRASRALSSAKGFVQMTITRNYN